MQRLTQERVNKLRLQPPAGDQWVADHELHNFGIRFRGGVGRFAIRYSFAGRDKRMSHSRIDKIALTEARAWAKKQFGILADRVDPGVERKRAVTESANTVGTLIDPFLEYLAGKEGGRAQSYLNTNRRNLEVLFKSLHPFSPNGVTRALVAACLKGIKVKNGPIMADRARSNLSNFFGWACKEGLCEVNPVEHTNKNGAQSRERRLTDDEIRIVWNATDNGTNYGTIIRLLILLPCRRQEIGGLTWQELNVNDQQLEFSGARTKNKKPFIMPLSPAAFDILMARKPRPHSNYIFGRTDGGFDGWSISKIDLDKRTNIEPNWTPHDLRRTFSTIAHERLKAQPHVVEACLNHAKRGVGAIYNRAEYLDDKRNVLNEYAKYIVKVIAG